MPAGHDRSQSWATSPSSSPTTAPTSGPGASCFARGRRPSGRGRRRAAGLLQRDRTVVGQSASTAGMPSSVPGTPGGSSASARYLDLVDRVRLDHFRGFEASWEVPRDAPTAAQGTWVKGPGAALFEAVRSGLGHSGCRSSPRTSASSRRRSKRCATASDCPAWRSCSSRSGRIRRRRISGRTISRATPCRLHRHARQRYDDGLVEGRRRAQHALERGHLIRTRVCAPLSRHRRPRRALGLHSRRIASVADTAIVPAQDLLGLGSNGRMNRPGTIGGNWRWRLLPEQLTSDVARKLGVMTETYERV